MVWRLLTPLRTTVSNSLLRSPLLSTSPSSSRLLQSSLCQLSLFTRPNWTKLAKSGAVNTADCAASKVKPSSTVKTSKKVRWSLDEDEVLLRGLFNYGDSGILKDGNIGWDFWNNIMVEGRGKESVRNRWFLVLKPLLVRELAGTRDDFIGVQLVDLLIKRKTNIQSKISWRAFTAEPQFTGFTSNNLGCVFGSMKAKTAKKYGLSLTEVTLVDIKEYLDTRKDLALNSYEKEQQLRVVLAYKIGLLKPGATLETLKEEFGDNLRCEHCGKTFLNNRYSRYSLERHYKSCKIRKRGS